jgi:hypothetical protein
MCRGPAGAAATGRGRRHRSRRSRVRGSLGTQVVKIFDQAADDVLLRPGDGYTVTLLLSGAPASHSRRIQHHGSLAAGKITTEPYGNGTGPRPA